MLLVLIAFKHAGWQFGDIGPDQPGLTTGRLLQDATGATPIKSTHHPLFFKNLPL